MKRHVADPRNGATTWRRAVWLLACGIMCAGHPTPSDVGAGSAAASSKPFDQQPVYEFQIELAPDQAQHLRRDSRRYVPARLRIDGSSYGQVGIRLKGHGSFRGLDDKPSFTVDFSRFEPGRRFRGLRKVHLNNSIQDGSFLREWIGSELFRAAGAPAPRVTHALVALNGRPLGLYVLKEGFAEEFFARNFARADGRLYEHADGETLPGGSAGGDPALRRLASAAREPDLKTRWQRLHDVLDVERFLSFMAMEVITCHWDGYSLARNNFRVYHDPASDKLVFLPTGMDQIFANPRLTWRPHMAGLVARALLEIPEGQVQYRARVEKLLNEDFKPARLCAQVRQRLSELSPALSGEALAQAQEETAALCAQIRERHEHLKLELAQPELALLSIPAQGALLGDWRETDCPAQGQMLEDRTPDGKSALHIVAGPVTSASWRSAVRLPSGHYCFQALVRARDVTPLPFGTHQGARLRIGRLDRESAALIGTQDWTSLRVRFEIPDGPATVELICELRASGGQVWFAKNSLLLQCAEPPAPEEVKP
jgi:spore coat protein H